MMISQPLVNITDSWNRLWKH